MPQPRSFTPTLLLTLTITACASDEGVGALQGESTSSTGTDPTTGPTPSTDAPPPTTGPEATTTTTGSTGDTGSSTTGAASTGEEIPTCGDGILAEDEQCDNGLANNTETSSCLPSCILATCGDGHVHAGVEECDLGPGNSNEYGGCAPNTCLWGPRCGDGVVTPGHELCDPGMLVDPADETAPCAPTCRYDGRVAFISSQLYTGKLGGLSGADLKCQALAESFDPGHAHSYRAWLGDGASGPAANFDHGPAFAATPYVRLDGVVVADSFDDLIQNGPAVGITITDTYEAIVEQGVWTHTTHEGEPVPDDHHCVQWTDDSFKSQGTTGWNAVPDDSPDLQAWADERWWTRYLDVICKVPRRLYCFEN